MRRFFIALFCCLLLTAGVQAASTATGLDSSTVVAANGTCQVTLTLQLRLDEVPGSLAFPLPREAKDISVNGSSVRAPLSGGLRMADLSGAVPAPGAQTLVIRYALPDAVEAAKSGKLTLKLELLSGFAYPIEHMRFSVTLPGAPEGTPEFTSTYHQEAVGSIITLTTDGGTITGEFTQGLKDHESLHMSLPVTEAMFPQPISKKWSVGSEDIIMYCVTVLALLYYLAALRALPPRRVRQVRAPGGLTAGELGCCLTGQGVDLTMTVVSWAQMGYLLIQLDDNGRVLLHRRMDMGNERSDFENRCFRTLFGRRNTVDATGFHYARLCARAARTAPGLRSYFQRRSGNFMVFRVLGCVIGLLGGISLGRTFAIDTTWQVILSILLGALGALGGWVIHAGAHQIHLRRRGRWYLALAVSAVWLLLGIWAGAWGGALYALAIQWLMGLAAAYGGRRSELGRQRMEEILGLRRYMRTAPREELVKCLRRSPEYYYELAPYAMALGTDRAFARQFGAQKLPECPYLTTGMDGHLTAPEWNRLLREAVSAMEQRQRRRMLERLLGK